MRSPFWYIATNGVVRHLGERHTAGKMRRVGALGDDPLRLRSAVELLLMGRAALLTAFLAAFGRAIAEVGAIIIVGGNIRGFTRTMTTTIALETSKGDLPLALALGFILILLSVGVSTTAFLLAGLAGRSRS
jgi:ABC-type tungstate transport system substrate-binding protein